MSYTDEDIHAVVMAASVLNAADQQAEYSDQVELDQNCIELNVKNAILTLLITRRLFKEDAEAKEKERKA